MRSTSEIRADQALGIHYVPGDAEQISTAAGTGLSGVSGTLMTHAMVEPPERDQVGRAAFSATDTEWHDWQWQQANRLRRAEDFERLFPLTADEREGFKRVAVRFAVACTPYYASLINPDDPNDPIRRQAIPSSNELKIAPGEHEDPLAEEEHMPVPGLTHRYPDRALLYVTHNCPVYCRHCFRRRKVGDPESALPHATVTRWVTYLKEHTEVRDVLLSGGDPLTLSDARLERLISELRTVPHLEVIRLATRNPVTLPQRITPALCAMLKRHHPIYVSTHFNHLAEASPEAGQALDALADAGCVINNQMVLLKGINDDVGVITALNQWMLKHRCQPYYLSMCDAAQGIEHFRTTVRKGIEVIDGLRGWTSGMAVPHLVLDLPGGGGKVTLQPEYLTDQTDRKLTFRNYRGEVFEYVEGSA